MSDIMRVNLLPEKVIVHHGGPDPKGIYDGSWPHCAAYYKRFHTEISGKEDIGFHYVVENGSGGTKIGQVTRGREEDMEGGHAKGMNTKSIGVCFAGSFDKEAPSKKQLEAGAELIADIVVRHGLGVEDIVPHSDFTTGKTCPGDKFPMDKLKGTVEKKLKKMKR